MPLGEPMHNRAIIIIGDENYKLNLCCYLKARISVIRWFQLADDVGNRKALMDIA